MTSTTVILIFISAIVLFAIYYFVDLARTTKRLLLNALKEMKPEDIPAMANECVDAFQSKLGRHLSLSNFTASIRILDDALQDRHRQGTRIAFNKEGVVFPFRYMVYIGAFLGELIRAHEGGLWDSSSVGTEAGLALDIGGTVVHPFNKIVKMILGDDPGNLEIYFATIIQKGKPSG